MHLPLSLLLALTPSLLPTALATFDIYFEGPFDPSKYQDWAYRVFNASDEAPSWAQVEAAPRFKRRDWKENLGDDQIPEGEIGCRAPSDCSDLYGCDRACSANVGYNATDIQVFDMHFHSDPLAPFHWILHRQDEHKDRLGNNVTAAPDGGMWMYNAHSNVAPEGYCVVHAGAEYHGVKQELGDYFKHGVRKLRCIIPDVSADDINDPEAYKRRTAPGTEKDDRGRGRDPMAGCARRGDCEVGASEGVGRSSAKSKEAVGTLRIVVWASTLVTVRTVSTLVVTEVEGRSTVRHGEGTTTASAPSLDSTDQAGTSYQSTEAASSTGDTGAAVPSVDIIPFEVAYSTTITHETLVTSVETIVKTIPQSSTFSTATSTISCAVSSDAVDTNTSASVLSASTTEISYSSSPASSISEPGSRDSIESSSLITNATPTPSVSNSSPKSMDTSTHAPVQNPTESSIPVSDQDSATGVLTAVSSPASVVFVTVVVTADPPSSSQVYDDGMWHTYYPVRNT